VTCSEERAMPLYFNVHDEIRATFGSRCPSHGVAFITAMKATTRFQNTLSSRNE
jgi:hypothetical protein